MRERRVDGIHTAQVIVVNSVGVGIDPTTLFCFRELCRCGGFKLADEITMLGDYLKGAQEVWDVLSSDPIEEESPKNNSMQIPSGPHSCLQARLKRPTFDAAARHAPADLKKTNIGSGPRQRSTVELARPPWQIPRKSAFCTFCNLVVFEMKSVQLTWLSAASKRYLMGTAQERLNMRRRRVTATQPI